MIKLCKYEKAMRERDKKIDRDKEYLRDIKEKGERKREIGREKVRQKERERERQIEGEEKEGRREK